MHDFRNLNLWVKAIELAEYIYLVTAKFPDNEKFGLVSQMRRCSVSISSNIAEGCGRKGDLELIHFLTIASGSTCELQSQTILANKLKFINDVKTKMINDKIEELKNMNYKLQQSIRNRKK